MNQNQIKRLTWLLIIPIIFILIVFILFCIRGISFNPFNWSITIRRDYVLGNILFIILYYLLTFCNYKDLPNL